MRVNILGTVEMVIGGQHVIRPAGHGQRAVLAALAAEYGNVVSADHLIRVIWGDTPPPTARAKIQAHVSALRRDIAKVTAAKTSAAMTPAAHMLMLQTIPPGYLLPADGADTDAAEFGRLQAQAAKVAENGDPALASALLGTALALWRGPVFADVASPLLTAKAEDLSQRRLLAVEAKAETDLSLGRYAIAAAELSGWLAAYPLRERLRGLTMLALHGLGCRAEALRVYQAGYRILNDELGVEPSTWLRELHHRILADAA